MSIMFQKQVTAGNMVQYTETPEWNIPVKSAHVQVTNVSHTLGSRGRQKPTINKDESENTRG